MKDLYIIGAGGFAIEVLFAIECSYKNVWKEFYIIDDDINKINSKIRGVTVISNLEDFIKKCMNKKDEELDILITINNSKTRRKIVDLFAQKNINVNYPNVIDHSAVIDFEYVKIGKGNVIMDFVGITGNVNLGNHNIIGARTGIGHDSSIGDFNSFSPRVSISGQTTVGNGNSFGLNSALLQNKTMGDNNTIWSYTMILRNIKNDGTYFGMPAKKLQI